MYGAGVCYRMYGGIPGGVAGIAKGCCHVYMCGGVLGVCALGCIKMYMLWCRYMCFLFVCQGNSEWVPSLAVYGGCHGDMHVCIWVFD